uniref:Uncharacterized protein n=1 Tax=Setaria italica TaxID=4555 RepID=K3ZK81_SETIT
MPSGACLRGCCVASPRRASCAAADLPANRYRSLGLSPQPSTRGRSPGPPPRSCPLLPQQRRYALTCTPLVAAAPSGSCAATPHAARSPPPPLVKLSTLGGTHSSPCKGTTPPPRDASEPSQLLHRSRSAGREKSQTE